MHVRIILEMIGCCLHLLENFLNAHQATDWFIQEREKSSWPSLSSLMFPNKDSVVFIAISFWWCNCLLAIAILLIFLERYNVVHILRIQPPYSLTSVETIYSNILSLQYDSI
jgi:hypothetical protein